MDAIKSKNEIIACIRLQDILFAIDENLIEKLNDFIESSIFITKNGCESLSHNFLHIIDYKPQKITILINYISRLTQKFPETNFFKSIFNEITRMRPTCSRLFFIYQCINHKIIPEDVIIPHAKTFEYFYWFAPIVERLNPQLFECFITKKDEDLFFSLINELRENNWMKHYQLASEGMNHHEVARLIRNDDIENLKKIPHFNINMRLPSSPFESIEILNHGCTPLHYASYFNSIKCYRTMLERGASAYATDFNGLNTINFSVAGGSFSILSELLTSSFNDNISLFMRNLTQAIQYSIIYHENSFIDDLTLKYNQYVNIQSMFLTAATSDNLVLILKCVDNGVDVNCFNSCGETALILAATNNHVDSVKFLLSIDSIDPTHCDTFGRNALICAIDKGNIDIVRILISDNRIDINSYDIF